MQLEQRVREDQVAMKRETREERAQIDRVLQARRTVLFNCGKICINTHKFKCAI